MMPTSLRGPSTAWSSMESVPLVFERSPARILSKVDLPQPLWPTIETNSLRPTVKETSRSASTSVPSLAWYTLQSRSIRIDSGMLGQFAQLRYKRGRCGERLLLNKLVGVRILRRSKLHQIGHQLDLEGHPVFFHVTQPFLLRGFGHYAFETEK